MANPEVRIEIVGAKTSRELTALVRRKLRAAVAPLAVGPIAAQAAFRDDNGPRGGVANRCALTVRLPYRPAIRADHTAASNRTAFDGAFAALERILARYRERARDARRHPKKYFVADKVVTGAVAPLPRPRRLRRRPIS